MTRPTRSEVLRLIDAVLAGDLSREEVSAWAGARHVQVADDPVVEEALDILTLIDARNVDDEGRVLDYMYDFTELSASRAALASENDTKDADG